MAVRAVLGAALAANAGASPHLVLFVVDDLGFGDVGYHGSDIPTPNIDRLAASGARLERYYVQPVCSPTRSTFMTGRYVHHTGFYTVLQPNSRAHLPEDAPTLAEKLRSAGYSTHMLGKWHLGYDSWNATPMGRGFDTHFGYFQGAEDYYTKTFAVPQEGDFFDFWDNQRPAYEQQGGYSLTQYMDRARSLISSHDKDTPFFLYFAHQTIHAPIDGLPAELKDEYEGRCTATTDRTRLKYCGMLTYFDDTVADFEKLLVDAGMWENTLLFFTTDNGGMVPASPIMPKAIKGAGCNWPLRSSKATTFEGGVRGAAFVAGGALPSGAAGTIRRGLMHSSDVFATFLSLAGAQPLLSIDGVDQWPMITEGSPQRDSVIIAPAFGSASVTTVIRGEMKLISGKPGIDGFWHCGNQSKERVPRAAQAQTAAGLEDVFLFNLTADPAERVNLASAMPDMVTILAELLAEAQAEAVDPQPTDADADALPFAQAHNDTLCPWRDGTAGMPFDLVAV